MKKQYLVIMGFIAAVVLLGASLFVVAPGSGAPVAAAAGTSLLDHFKGYKIINPIPVQDPIVVLQDEFDQRLQTKELKVVGPGDMFFNPVTKTTANGTVTNILDPNAHLERFPINNVPGTPSETTWWSVSVQNQFTPAGLSQNLTLAPATHILVPTAQILDAIGSNIPTNLDHYKWYPVIKGKPVSAKISLADQFGNWTNVMVLTPIAFANPVDKTHLLSQGSAASPTLTHSPILNPAEHIVAYRINVSPNINQHATIFNQFVSSQPVELMEGRILLVPSSKLAFSPLANHPSQNSHELDDLEK